MIRTVLATLAGLIVAFVVITLVEMLGHSLFPIDLSVIDLTDPEAMERIVENIPTAALLMILLAYIVGSFAGGLLASILAGRGPGTAPFSVGVILMVLGLFNAFSLPHPTWFLIANFLIYIPMAWLGHLVVCKKQSS